MRVRNTYSGLLISSRRHRTVSVLMLVPKELVEDPHWLFYLRGEDDAAIHGTDLRFAMTIWDRDSFDYTMEI